MSAAEKLERVALDYYPTPLWVVDAIMPHLPSLGSVLDPCCGVGEILEAFPAPVAKRGIEIDPSRASEASAIAYTWVQCADALAASTVWPDADAVVMNPPFSHAAEFIGRALEWRTCRPGSTVACLARLSILEPARDRRHLLTGDDRPDVYVLPERPRFRGDTAATDSVTACWLLWGPARGGRIFWLPERAR